MKIQEVIDRALQDPQFAADLQAKALAAGRAGARGQEFKDLLGEFASSPQELANFDRVMNIQGVNVGQDAVGTTTATVTLTGLTVTTVVCTTTTTTTTTTLTTGHLE
jgi:hypothetical protein